MRQAYATGRINQVAISRSSFAAALTAASNKEIRSSSRLRNTPVGTFHSISQRIAFLFRKRAHGDFSPTNSLLPSLSSILKYGGGIMRVHQAAISAPPIRIEVKLVFSLAVGNLSSLTCSQNGDISGMTFVLFGDQHTRRSRNKQLSSPDALMLSDRVSGSYCSLSSE